MGYYRRFSVLYYLLTLTCGALWLWLTLTGDTLSFVLGLVFFLFFAVAAASACTLAAVHRFQAGMRRMLQTGNTSAFLKELNGCARAAKRGTYNTILLAQVYTLQLAGNLQEAAKTLQLADPDYAKGQAARQNDRCAYSVRCAGLALQLGQFDTAEQHMESLRSELLSLRCRESLYIHYTKCLTDLSAMAAVLKGEGSDQTLYFSNLLKVSSTLVERAQTSYYLGLSLLRQGRTDEALQALSFTARSIPGLLLGRRAAALLNCPQALAENRQNLLFGEMK